MLNVIAYNQSTITQNSKKPRTVIRISTIIIIENKILTHFPLISRSENKRINGEKIDINPLSHITFKQTVISENFQTSCSIIVLLQLKLQPSGMKYLRDPFQQQPYEGNFLN